MHTATWQRLQPLVTDCAGPIFTTGEGRELTGIPPPETSPGSPPAPEFLNRFSPHLLRHTFVTLARQAGCPLEEVQDAVGHPDPAPPAATTGPCCSTLIIPAPESWRR